MAIKIMIFSNKIYNDSQLLSKYDYICNGKLRYILTINLRESLKYATDFPHYHSNSQEIIMDKLRNKQKKCAKLWIYAYMYLHFLNINSAKYSSICFSLCPKVESCPKLPSTFFQCFACAREFQSTKFFNDSRFCVRSLQMNGSRTPSSNLTIVLSPGESTV